MRHLGVLLAFAACTPTKAPYDKLPCTVSTAVLVGTTVVPDGGVTATGSRYTIPFVTTMPSTKLYVSPSGSDSADGTMATPKATIQAALDAADAGTAVMIASGTYTENITFTHSGQVGNPIWLISADGPGLAKVVPSDNETSTIQGYGVHDLVIQGLDVTAATPTSGDVNGIKFAASGLVSEAANQNANLAIVDSTIHCSVTAGYNGVKISTADSVFLIHDVFDGAGGPANGDALDLVGVTNSEVAYSFATNVPAHAAIQIKGGSTRVFFHDNIISGVGADGLWIGGGTIEEFMHPSSGYEACDVTVTNNVMHDLGQSAIHFVGGQKSRVTHLFTYSAGNSYVQAEVSPDHAPPLTSIGNSVLTSVFDPSNGVLYVAPPNPEGSDAVLADPLSDLPLTTTSNTTGNNTFTGGALIHAGGGHDVYALTSGQGTTVITGFQTASDVVQLWGYTFPNAAAVLAQAHQVGPSVLINLTDGYMLVLEDVALKDLSSTHFAL